MFDKRGQQTAAAGAAVLVLIIAGLLILFIVLLPPQERAEFLDEDFDDGNRDRYNDLDGFYDDDDLFRRNITTKRLLRQSPGRIDYLDQEQIEHPLPVINIFTSTESQIIAQKNRGTTKKAIFTEEASSLHFSIDDPSLAENFLLSANVEEGKGDLIIFLNDEEVFRGVAREGPLTPIRLSKSLLSAQNTLTFTSSSPGIAFWNTHQVILTNIKVVADVTSTEAQVSRNVFLVSETEKENLERVVLRFQPDCEYGTVGPLSIAINGRSVYSGVPDCALAMVPIEFAPELVSQGENEIIFRTDRGPYLLSHVLIESELEKVDFPTYYFEISHEQYEDIQDGLRRVRLRMEFVDVTVAKQADLIINGRITNFDTRDVVKTFDISNDIVRGNNAVKIKPRKTLEVRELRVDLVK